MRLRSWILNLLSAALIGGLFYYLYVHWPMFEASVDLSSIHAAGIALCVLGTWTVNALQSSIMIRLQGIHAGFRENLLVQSAAVLANYLPMRAGTALRFHYFKAVHSLDYSRLGGISAIRTVLLVGATGLAGSLGLIWLRPPSALPLWAMYLGMIGAALLAWLVAARTPVLPDSALGRFLTRFLQGFGTLAPHPGVAVLLLVLVLIQFCILALRLWISFDVLGVQMAPAVLLLLAPAATLLSFITITPGNLGLREWVIGALSLATGHPFAEGVFAASVDRAVLMVCTFLFGAPALAWVWVRVARVSKHPAAEKAQ